MLFKKNQDSLHERPKGPEDRWPQEDDESQNIWAHIDTWNYKVFPSLRTREFGRWLFQFEGKATIASLQDIDVGGEIKIFDPSDPPDDLQCMWRNVPKEIEGHCRYLEAHDKTRQGSLDVTLYCQPAALDWIYRAFSVGSQSRQGGIHIQLQVDCPNKDGEAFWRDQWRSEYLRVAHWELFSGANLKMAAQREP